MSGYAKIAEGLRMMAEGYEQLADVKTDAVSPSAKAEKEIPKAKAATKQETKQEEAQPEKEEQPKKVAVTDVRAAMRQKIKDGKMEACQEVLHSFGCEKLTDVPEDKLGELLAKVEVL